MEVHETHEQSSEFSRYFTQLATNRQRNFLSNPSKRITLIPILKLLSPPLNPHPLKLRTLHRLLQLQRTHQTHQLIRIDLFVVENTFFEVFQLLLAVSDDYEPIAAVLDGARTDLAGLLEQGCEVLFAVAGVVLLRAEVGGEGVEVVVRSGQEILCVEGPGSWWCWV